MSKDLLIGFHAIEEALSAGKDIDRVLIKRGLNSPSWQTLKARLKNNDVPVQQVPVEKLDGVARGKPHQGAIAYAAAVVYQKIEDLIPTLYEDGEIPLLLLLDGVTDIGNIGAISRTAEALGVHALLLPTQGAARLGVDAIKTSAGALSHLPVCRMPDPQATITYLKDSGITIAAATEKAWKTVEQADLTVPICICMGAEGSGVSPEILEASDEQLSISMRGKINSLNVGIACAIMLHVADLQRNYEAQ